LFLRRDAADVGAEKSFARVTRAFPAHVRGLTSHDVDDGCFRLRVWSDPTRTPAFARHDASGAWLAVVGNPTSPELRTVAQRGVVEQLLAACLRDGPAAAFQRVSPPFLAVFRAAENEAVVAVDRCGIQHAYLCEEGDGRTWVTSSSLSVAAALGLPLDVDGLTEWLSIGHFISGRTFFLGMRKLGTGERIRVGPPRARVESLWAPSPPDELSSSADYGACFLESLRSCYREELVAVELTGGLDTRLLLAGQLTLGLPSLFWTIGQRGCDELQTIDELNRCARFEHYTVDVDAGLGSTIPALVEELHALSDGEVNALEYAPLLLAFDDLRDRRTISITGSGGENARGFYYRVLKRGGERLRGVPVEALFSHVTKFTDGVRFMLNRDVVEAPDAVPTAAVRDFVAGSPESTPEGILDDFYLRTRMQRFAGRNISTTGLFCRQGLPFFADDLVDVTTALPLEARRDGRVVRETIAALQPRLATVPLDTGIPVQSPSWQRPGVAARRSLSLARRGAVKFGGRFGAVLAARPPETIPWHAVRNAPVFRDFLQEHLLGSDARLGTLFDRQGIETRVTQALDGSSLYPVGLLLTVELTLRRLASTSQD
jgi:hypothetical protein